MSRPPQFPILIRNQSVVVRLNREKAKSSSSGYLYRLSWTGARGRERDAFVDLEQARDEAERKAAQLAQGLKDSETMTRHDAFELREARALTGDVPVLSALKEWKKAHELTAGAILPACENWASRRTPTLRRIKTADAVDAFISAKNRLNKQGQRTYGSKLKPVAEMFGKLYLDTIPTGDWTEYLEQFEDPVTRNDMRKRAVSLCRWAKKQNHLPRDRTPDIEETERAHEGATEIGILDPETYKNVLNFFRTEHPELLGAVVLAGFAGLRSDEIHGKRPDREPRQRWDHIDLVRKYLRVTAAKTNTPADRIVHLTPNAVMWLRICPNRDGFVCGAADMEVVRRLALAKGFDLPENCFRHSYITYRVAATGDKPTCATEAGNSVKEIDARYRVPQPKFRGKAWFAILPPQS